MILRGSKFKCRTMGLSAWLELMVRRTYSCSTQGEEAHHWVNVLKNLKGTIEEVR